MTKTAKILIALAILCSLPVIAIVGHFAFERGHVGPPAPGRDTTFIDG